MAVKGTFPRGWRPTPEQLAFREAEVLRLTRDRYTTDQIAAAMGINDGTVRKGLRGIKRPRLMKPERPDPPPVDWLHPPADTSEPDDRLALATRHYLAEVERGRGVQAHAADLLDARLHNDTGWEKRWLGDIARLREVVGALERLHADDAFLRACALGRTVEEDSERVHESGQGVRGVVQPAVSMPDEVPGPRGLGGHVEDDEDNERPPYDLPQHPSSVTLRRPAANGVRV